VRKAAAGVLIGACAAGIVLALTNLEAFRTVELKTYDWRGKPALIAYDVLFADEDLRVGFPYGGDTWSGSESDKALADTIRGAGNVVLLADATIVGETTGKQTLPDQRYRLSVPEVLERHVVFPPAGPLSDAGATLGHNFLSLDPDGPSCILSNPQITRACDRKD
jgi:hypothetical protein